MSKFNDSVIGAASNLERLNGIKEKAIFPVVLFGVLDHVSKSGMLRKISLFYMKENYPVCICREVKVSGAGMDMGFHLAYEVYMEAYGKIRPYQDNFEFHWM